MRKLALEVATAIALTLAAILALAGGARASDISVTAAFARASATAKATTGVVYFTIANSGGAADRLVAVSSPAAEMVMIHETRMSDGVAEMAHVDGLTVEAGASVTLGPSGLHAMLTGLKAPLKKGGRVELKLVFEKAGEIRVSAPIGGVAQNAPPP